MSYVGYEGYDTVVEDNNVYLKAKAEYDADVVQYDKDVKARDKQIKLKEKEKEKLEQAKIEETQKHAEVFASETKVYEKKVEEEQVAFKEAVSEYVIDSKKQYDADLKIYETHKKDYDKVKKREDEIQAVNDKYSSMKNPYPYRAGHAGKSYNNDSWTNWNKNTSKSKKDELETIRARTLKEDGWSPASINRGGFIPMPTHPTAKKLYTGEAINQHASKALQSGQASSSIGNRWTRYQVEISRANAAVYAGGSLSAHASAVQAAKDAFDGLALKEQKKHSAQARAESYGQLQADSEKWKAVTKSFSTAKTKQDNVAKTTFNAATNTNIVGQVPKVDMAGAPIKPKMPSTYNSNPMLNKGGVITSPQIDSQSYLVDQPKKGNQKVQAENMKQKIYTNELKAGNVGLATALLQPQTAQKYFGKDTRNLKSYLTGMGYDVNNPDSIPDSVLMNPTKYSGARSGKVDYKGEFFAPKTPVLSTAVTEKRATARAKWEGVVIPDAPTNPVAPVRKPKQKVSKVSVTGTADLPSWTFNGEKFTDKSKLDAYVATRKQQAQFNSGKNKLYNIQSNKSGSLNPSGYIAPVIGESYNSDPVLNKTSKSATPKVAPLKTATDIPSNYSGDIFSVTDSATGVTKQFRKESRAQEYVDFVNNKNNPLPPKPQWVITSDEKLKIPKMGGGQTVIATEKENVFDSLAEAEAFDKAQKYAKSSGDYDNYSLFNYADSVEKGLVAHPSTTDTRIDDGMLIMSQGFRPIGNIGKAGNNLVSSNQIEYNETASERLIGGTIDDIIAGKPLAGTGVNSAYNYIKDDPVRFIAELPAEGLMLVGGGKIIQGGTRGLKIIQEGVKEVLPKTHPIIKVGSKMESGYNTGIRVMGKPVRALQVVNQKVLGKVNDYAITPISQTVEKTSTGQMIRTPVFSNTQKVLDKSIKFTKNINNKFTMIDDTRVGLKLKAELKLTPTGRQTRKHTIDEANKMMNESEEGYRIMQPVKKYELNYYDKTTSSIYTPLHPEMSGKLLQMKGGFGNVKIDKVKVTEIGKKQDAKIAKQARDDAITGKYSESRQGRMNYYQNPKPKVEVPKPKSALSKWINSKATRLPTKESVEKKLGISWIKKTNKKIENKQFAKEHMFVDVVEVNLSKAQQITIRGILPKGLTKTTVEKSTQGFDTLTTVPLNKANKKIIEKAVADEKLTLVGQKTTTKFNENSDHWLKLEEAQIPLKKNEFNFKQGQTILAESKIVKDVKPVKGSKVKTFDPSDLKSSTEEFGRWNRGSGVLEGESKLPITLPKGGGTKMTTKAEDDLAFKTNKGGDNSVSQLINKKEIPKPDKTTGKGGKGFIEGEGKSIAKSNWKNPYKQYSLGGIVTGEVAIPLHKNAPRIDEGNKLDTGLGTDTGIQGKIDTRIDTGLKSNTSSILKNETKSLTKRESIQKYRTQVDVGLKLDSSMSLATAEATVPVMIKPQRTLTRTKKPVGVIIDMKPKRQTRKRTPMKRGEKAGFIGNVRADSIVGVYKRADITYGKKRVTKLEKQDKRMTGKASTRISGSMSLVKTKAKKKKKTESLLGHTFKKSKDEFSLSKQSGGKGKRVKASLF